MTGQQLLNEIYTKYRGKIASRTPAFGSDKSNVAIAIANSKIQEWATDPRNKWNSLFDTVAPNEPGTVATTATTALTGTSTYFTDYNVGDKIIVSGETVRTIATIASDTSLTVTVAFTNTASAKTFTRSTIVAVATTSYKLPRRLFQPSDFARVVKTDASYVDYQIIKAQQRSVPSGQSTYIHGLNPKKITFSQTIEAGLAGGTMTVPGYYIPAELVDSTDVVPVDDPVWLVYITASELARNDPAKEDQFPILAGMANELYSRMSNANNDVGFLQSNTVVNNFPVVGTEIDNWLD